MGFKELATPEGKGKEAVRRKAEKKLKKPVKGQFDKHKLPYRRYLKEIRLQETTGYEVGQELDVDVFNKGEKVDVSGTSKGKGFAGTMKRYNFNGGPESHGSMSHRRPASGGSTDAAHTLKGSKRPGQMGNVKRTARNLTIVDVDKNNHLLLIKGSLPGANNSLLVIKETTKNH